MFKTYSMYIKVFEEEDQARCKQLMAEVMEFIEKANVFRLKNLVKSLLYMTKNACIHISNSYQRFVIIYKLCKKK